MKKLYMNNKRLDVFNQIKKSGLSPASKVTNVAPLNTSLHPYPKGPPFPVSYSPSPY